MDSGLSVDWDCSPLPTSDTNQLRIPLRLNKSIAQQISKQQIEDARQTVRKSQSQNIEPGKRLIVEFERSDGKVVADSIIRDISDEGAGLWIGCFIHPNTKCWLTLPSTHGAEFAIEGTVRWCKHFTHSIHEIGIQLRREEAKILIEALESSDTPKAATVDVQAGIRAIILALKPHCETGLSAEDTDKLCEQLTSLLISP